MSVTSLLTATTSTIKPSQNGTSADSVPLLPKLNNPSELQLKLEKQLQKSRKVKAESVSSKNTYNTKIHSIQEQFSLVSDENSDFDDINLQNNDDDDDDDDVVIFKQPSRGKALSDYSSDCTDQLLRDGYRLDELSDDEDLDLIPPRTSNTSWCSCENMSSCNIQ